MVGASHWSSGCGFDPPSGTQKSFIWGYNSTNVHLSFKVFASSHISKIYITLITCTRYWRTLFKQLTVTSYSVFFDFTSVKAWCQLDQLTSLFPVILCPIQRFSFCILEIDPYYSVFSIIWKHARAGRTTVKRSVRRYVISVWSLILIACFLSTGIILFKTTVDWYKSIWRSWLCDVTNFNGDVVLIF